MSDSNKSRKRNSLLEFTLPNALLTTVMDTIGQRRMSKLTTEARARVLGAVNMSATEIAKVFSESQSAPKRRSSKPKTDTTDDSTSEGS